jgi:hypothetical protein
VSPFTAERTQTQRWIEEVPWQRLSARARETMERIATLLADGFTNQEAAAQLGIPTREVAEAMRELREEARSLVEGAALPPLEGAEREALRVSLQELGQLVPLLVDEHGELIDGANRRALLEELGIEPVTRTIDLGDDPERRQQVRLAANMVRRSVSAAARRQAIEAELVRNPDRSDRAIAAALGIANHTVAAARRELEERGTLLRLERRVGADGVRQKARKTRAQHNGTFAETGSTAEPRSSARTPAHDVPQDVAREVAAARTHDARLVVDPADSTDERLAYVGDEGRLRLLVAEALWTELGRPLGFSLVLEPDTE